MSGSRIVFTRQGFWRGVRISLPMVPAMAPFGLIVGVIAASVPSGFLDFVEACLPGLLRQYYDSTPEDTEGD